MQCFQKDPNLRVSARKLLKHPWIVNAKRSDAVVPKKPTQYDEAVKSVQEWNEALKSPNAGSLRRAPRPVSSSPIPGKREAAQSVATQARTTANLVNSKMNTEQFRSPSNKPDDNWDDDFDAAISPAALQLPHLKPQDNFGGLLSSEKLKAFASCERASEEDIWDDEFEGDMTVKSPSNSSQSDPLRTIRPARPKLNEPKPQKPSTPTSPQQRRSTAAVKSDVPKTTSYQKSPPSQKVSKVLSTSLFVESEEEDYSDLVTDDIVFLPKVGLRKVRIRKLVNWMTY